MEEPKQDVLEYFPELPRVESSAVAWYVIVLPFVVAMAASALIAPGWALPLAGLTMFVLWRRDRAARKRPHRTLRVAESRLFVTDADGRLLLKVKLSRLRDVTLDTKTIQKVQENLSSGIPDLRFIDSRVAPAIDNSRIELVTARETVVLTEHYTSSTDASDWFTKIRRFLRKNGWQPWDERETKP
jgi:hypothetical protein